MKKILASLFAIAILAVLAGCNSGPATATATAFPPTFTPPATFTPPPTFTPIPTNTPTSTPSATLSPTPVPVSEVTIPLNGKLTFRSSETNDTVVIVNGGVGLMGLDVEFITTNGWSTGYSMLNCRIGCEFPMYLDFVGYVNEDESLKVTYPYPWELVE